MGMDFDYISYELGVMMYNVSAKTSTNNYDLEGNFEGIFIALKENVDKSRLHDGFIAESENHGVDFDKANRMFEESFEIFI